MKIRRPRTLLGMVLMGLAFVTVPLLVAVGNAMVKLGQLAAESEVVLDDSATATLENQRLVNLLERMERNVRLYFLLQNVASRSESLALYDGDQAALEASIAALRALPSDETIREHLTRITSVSKEVHRALRTDPTAGAGDAIIERFSVLRESTRAVTNGMRDAINVRLETPADATDRPRDSRARRGRLRPAHYGQRTERH
jgi:hypothetical protein